MTKSAIDPCKSATWSTAGPWNAPELDSPAQRAKWERAAAKPEVIRLHFLGEPAPQGSKIQTRYGGMKEASKKIQPWRASVQYICDQTYKGEVLTCPVRMEVTFLIARAKNHWSTAKGKEDQVLPSAPEHCTVGGDIDKLARGLLDPLTTRCGGNVIEDDRQVVDLKLSKRYAEKAESVGALVTIIPLR